MTRLPISAALALAVTLPTIDGAASEPSTTLERKSGFAEVPGGKLFYETAGAGEAIVLVHGNAGDHRHWDSQFNALADDYRVVRYDVRGFGKSSVPIEGESYSDHEDLATLMDYLGIRMVHVAGWSMGSGIAIDFALAYPERTKSLISVGPWVSGYSSPAADGIFADMAQVSAAIAGGGLKSAVDAWMKAPFFSATTIDAGAAERFREIAVDYSFWAFTHSSPQRALEPSATLRTHEIKVPTLILTAEHDIPACREVADLLNNSISGSQKIIMKGTGHLLHMEKPAEFNRHVLSFLHGASN